jgi:3-hydroxyisobutyrate dehydrogenase-like beta-hydroxyacid dehydrogenase
MKRLTPNQVKLGFIGLGNMGSRIAQRLPDHGYQLAVYDVDIAKSEAIRAHGGIVAENILELARTADVILSCLTNEEAVRSAYTGSEGVFAGSRPGTVVLELSTISPETSRELHRLGVQVGTEVLDVAISGSTPAAEQGILTLLVGGDRELFGAAEPMELACRRSLRLWPLGRKLVSTARGCSKFYQRQLWLLRLMWKSSLDDYTPQFPLRLMNKDFQLILAAAAKEQVRMPATRAAFRVNSDELANNNEEDFSAVVRQMEVLADIATIHSTPVAS